MQGNTLYLPWKSLLRYRFPNMAGGYEMRSPYYKGAIAPKEISVANTAKDALACCLFEGFMDFLSYLTLVKQGKLLPPCGQPDLIVLNSVNNLSKALSRLKAYKKNLLLSRQ